jgi:hypothetical protein
MLFRIHKFILAQYRSGTNQQQDLVTLNRKHDFAFMSIVFRYQFSTHIL